MAKSKNAYFFPVDRKKAKIDRTSPAHVGPLMHSVDFIVPKGTPVKAALSGIIIEVKDDSRRGSKRKKFENCGNYIEIKHPFGEFSEYEHLEYGSALVKKGDRVRKGQVIAKSGATGWIAHLGPHLHFMVGVYGKPAKNYKTLEIVWKNSV